MANQEVKQVLVRIPSSLLKKLDTAAKRKYLTRNHEIRTRLEESFLKPQGAKRVSEERLT